MCHSLYRTVEYEESKLKRIKPVTASLSPMTGYQELYKDINFEKDKT